MTMENDLGAPSTANPPSELTLVEAPRHHVDAPAVPVIPGYELIRILGRGGMGVVWEALEHRLDRKVALKVHADAWEPEHTARMWSEARLAAKVADPGVVAVHDYGLTLSGAPYYTMDLVDGTDLRALLREGPLPQARVLELAVEIARAVAAAHERGIVHRDLKPTNVLVDRNGRARILDFGLAFSTITGRDLYADRICGTPGYMSPEQISGLPVGPPSDIHSIGILLYEMLTGVRPFVGSLEAPVPPSRQNPAVHDDVARVCLRCLEKKPEERFASARELCGELEALAAGRPLGTVSQRPIYVSRRPSSSPPRPCGPSDAEQDLTADGRARKGAELHFRWSWALRSPPEKLWPFVSDTDRLNRAIGLPPVLFTDKDDEGVTRRTGQLRKLGLLVEWREHPFEWIREREHSVFRSYSRGPFKALWNRVQLAPRPGGGTDLTHEVWVDTKGAFGRVVAWLEIEKKTARALDRVYRQIDSRLVDPQPTDPFEESHCPSSEQSRHIDTAERALIERHLEVALVKRLTELLRHGPAHLLASIRPYALADLWRVGREETIDLCLNAANVGLLDLAWDLVCPKCMSPHESTTSLGQIEKTGTCSPCATSYERDLGDSVELVFRPHPEVRGIAAATYCAGAPALRPHVFAQQRLAAGETRTFTMSLPPGDYRVARARGASVWDFSASPTGFISECGISLDADAIAASPGVVRAGEITFTVANVTLRDDVVRIEIPGLRKDSVSAAAAMTLPHFRDFFSNELLAEGQNMSVRRLAFLFLEFAGDAGLFQEKGDAVAWAAFQKLDAIIDEQLRALRGVRVPASVGSYATAFGTCSAAVDAGLRILVSARDASAPFSLRAGVHEGPCIALTRGGSTEYFGKTIHRGQALLAEAPVGGLVLSVTVAADRATAQLIHGSKATGEVVASRAGAYKGTRVTRVFLTD